MKRWILVALACLRMLFGVAPSVVPAVVPVTAVVVVATQAGCTDLPDDGYGESPSPTNDNDGDGSYAPEDCDDEDVNVYPGATETCDNKDNNCDQGVDEGVLNTYYIDVDGDGYGGVQEQKACTKPPGYVTASGDCNDTQAASYPGADETCDSLDNNCDGTVDEGFDADGDGDGVLDCLDDDADGDSYSALEGDCNDTDASINPGITETCDSLDNNCDGTVDEGFDADGDGYKDATSCGGGNTFDCNDFDASINPGVTEICDSLDNNCDGLIDAGVDVDKDGYTVDCSGIGADCDDAKNYVHPGATERCNELDDDCDGKTDDADTDVPVQGTYTWYMDSDGDGFGNPAKTSKACAKPAGYVSNKDDCNDNDPGIYPDAVEVCDDVDQNCDDVVDNVDADEDGSVDASCDTAPDTADDCNDEDAEVNPEAIEVCDDIDQDCDTVVDDVDADEDGYDDKSCSTAPTGANDCNDKDASIHPGAADPANDGIDQDCDGNVNGRIGDWSPHR